MHLPLPALAPRTSAPAAFHVDRYTTHAGPVELQAVAEHRIKVHTGKAVTGTCGISRFRYAHGDIDLLPAGSGDAWEEDNGGTSVMLRFAPALLARTADELGLDGAQVGLQLRHQFRDTRIAHLAWALDADHRDDQPNGRLYAESLSTALLSHLVARHRTAEAIPRGLPRAQLACLVEYIEANLDQDLSLAQLATVAGLSASHLKTQFKRATGFPVHAYVVRRRVERARQLLVRRDLPASQIALEAGFAHQSHMVRSLRRVLGAEAEPLLRRGAAVRVGREVTTRWL